MASQTRMVKEALEEAIEKSIIALSTNITTELQDRTPVATGWARANWVPGLGGPGNSSSSSRPDGSQGAAQAAGISSLSSYKLEIGPVFVTNNVPYITRLNDGYSAQAPSGFVQQGIAAAVSRVGR